MFSLDFSFASAFAASFAFQAACRCTPPSWLMQLPPLSGAATPLSFSPPYAADSFAACSFQPAFHFAAYAAVHTLSASRFIR